MSTSEAQAEMGAQINNHSNNVKEISDDVFNMVDGIVYDFQKMVAVDWDEMYDGAKLTPRAYTSWNALNITRLTLATWILGSHVAIVTFVLAIRVLRNQPKNLLIVNVALANILMGAFVIPAKLHFILEPENVDCNLAVGWTFVSDYYQTSLSLFTVFSLVFERFVYVYTEKSQKNVHPWAIKTGTILLIIGPWILSCLLLLPTFFGGLLVKSEKPDQCIYKVNDGYFVASQLISFILPSLGVFILAPFTGLLDCLRPKRCFYKPLTPKGESMIVTVSLSLFSIFCEAPYCIVRVLMMRMECNNSYCSRFSEALTLTMWIRVCKASVFPFIWLAYTDIRQAMMCKLSARRQGDQDSDDEEEEEIKVKGDHQRFPLTQSSTKK